MDYALLLSEDQEIRGHILSSSGRLHGSEMARRAWQREEPVALQTLRADIDYAQEEANTSFGRIGVNAWVYRGDVLPGCNKEYEEPLVG